jgi:SAM-dependent methyltransferase
MAGCAIPTSSAGHAQTGAKTNPKLTFKADHLVGAGHLSEIPINSIDVVFTSNFLEHLENKRECTTVFEQVWKILKPGGRFIVMGPNIHYAYRVYWDYYDHNLALSELSVSEGLQQCRFQVERMIPRFLPYTMKTSLPINNFFIRLYLKLPYVWRFFGKQFLVIACKVC